MSRNDEEDLLSQMKNIYISTAEEVLAADLQKTHITNERSPVTPKPHSHTAEPSWQPNATADMPMEKNDEDEGWGDNPPAYTAISQGTYFGFSSLLGDAYITPASDTQLQPHQPFARYQNKPISFVSAANAHNTNPKLPFQSR